MDGLVGLIALLLLGCTASPIDPVACAPAYTWDDADLALRSCRACHGPTAEPLDTPDALLAVADGVPDVLDDPSHARPLSPGDAAALESWLACPIVPADPQIPSCDGTLWPGDAGPSDAPCASGATRVEGDLELGVLTRDVDCLCEVGGDVVLGGDADLPALTEIGGAVVAAEGATRLDLPSLVHAGELRLEESDSLRIVRLPALTSLDGPVRLGARGLVEVDLPRLTEVAELDATGALNLTRLDTPRLHTVHGDLRLNGLPYLSVWTGVPALVHVGGDLELAELPSWAHGAPFNVSHVGGDLAVHGTDLPAIDGFDQLVEVPGELSLTINRLATRIDGFHALERVGRALRIAANDDLEQVSAFGALTEVGLDGDVEDESHQLRIAFNFALTEVDGFGALTHAGAISIVGNEALAGPSLSALTTVEHELALRASGATTIDGLGALTAAGSIEVTGHTRLRSLGGFNRVPSVGTVLVADNPLLEQIGGLSGLTSVEGDLALERMRRLTAITGLEAITRVGGDLVLRDLAALPAPLVDAFVDRVTVDGAVIRD
ncbi:MAG: hypothetical protein ACI8PZ_004679 [Myxococcota bacterium]|jgi:hypothetical protein